ncbi:MAG: BACON domain-containing protein [Bacteroidales bacterium]|nr:BACON domain-containing protein [Candidatus Cryptobacteroides caccocaballi]
MSFKFLRAFMPFTLSVMLLASCNHHEEVPAADPSLEISSVTIDGAEGSYSVPYSIKNPVEGTKLQASTTADWISDVKVIDTDVTFAATANLSAPRSTELKVSYGDLSKTVSVTQSSFRFESFNLSVSNIKSTGATVKIQPRSYKGNYFFEVFSKAAVDRYLALDTNKPGDSAYADALYQSDLDYLMEMATNKNEDLYDYLLSIPNMYKVTVTGESTEITYSNLKRDTEYYVVAYGMDFDGTRTTEVALYLFDTHVESTGSLSFTSTVTDVKSNSAHITIVPSDPKATYYWTYVSDTDHSKYTTSQIVELLITSMKESAAYGYTIADFLSTGTQSELAEDLSMGTQYFLIAWGMDAAGNITSDIQELDSFTTTANEVTDDCTFTITPLEIEAMDIKVRIEPSNESTMYYTAFIDEKRCKGYNDYQMVQRIINMENSRIEDDFYEGVSDWTNLPGVASGRSEVWGRRDYKWTFEPEHTYRIYVFGVDVNGNCTTAIERLDVTTIEAQPSNITFETSLGANTWHNTSIDITPSNNEDYYLAYLVPTATLDTYRYNDGSLMEKEIMDQIRDVYEDEISQYVFRGPRTFYSTWLSNRGYSLLLFGYAGSNTTPMYEFKFKSPAIPFDKADCDINYTYELFRGDDLIALNPGMWAGSEGDCVMRVRITTTGDPCNYYFGIWGPKENYATSGGMDHLVTLLQMDVPGDNIINKNFGFLKPWWYGMNGAPTKFKTDEGEELDYFPWSITAYAEDEDGNYGPLHYTLMVPIPEPKDQVTGKYCVGYTEAYDFWSSPSTTEKSIIIKMADPNKDIK